MSGLVMVPAGTGPPLLILSAEKRNQNSSGDLVLVFYPHGFTNRSQGLDRLRGLKVGFAGNS